MYYIMDENGNYVDRNAYKDIGTAEAVLAKLAEAIPENSYRIIRLG